MVIANGRSARAVGVANRRRVGHAVAIAVVVYGAPGVARPEQQPHNSDAGQLLRVGEEVLNPVVLIVAGRVVLRVVVLVADRDLPHDGRSSRGRRYRAEVLLPPGEVREVSVQAVPPHVTAEYVRVVAGVAVRDVVEDQVITAGSNSGPFRKRSGFLSERHRVV